MGIFGDMARGTERRAERRATGRRREGLWQASDEARDRAEHHLVEAEDSLAQKEFGRARLEAIRGQAEQYAAIRLQFEAMIT